MRLPFTILIYVLLLAPLLSAKIADWHGTAELKLIKNFDLAFAEKLIKEPNTGKRCGINSLMLLAAKGNLRALKRHEQNKGLFEKDCLGRPITFWAAAYARKDVLQFLFAKHFKPDQLFELNHANFGAYVGDSFHRYFTSMTMLQYFVFSEKERLIPILIKFGAINVFNENQTALHTAVMIENYEITKLLLENGANANAKSKRYKCTPYNDANMIVYSARSNPKRKKNIERIISLLREHGATTRRDMNCVA